jgi:alpha-L-fucosidase 2
MKSKLFSMRVTDAFIGTMLLVASTDTICHATEAEIEKDNPMNAYNVIWTTPSQDYNGSMPIGNGELAANVWVEPTGDLIFLLSKSDTWSGGSPSHGPELLKLGRVRVRLDKSLFHEGAEFRQELDLKTGSIIVHYSLGDQKREVRFWIDAHRPVVHVDIQSSVACTAEFALESWRAEGMYLQGLARKDVILPSDGQTVRWYQRNVHSCYADTMINQHMGDFVDTFHDPLMHRTFGGLMAGEGLKPKDDKTLVTSEPTRSIHVSIHALTAQTETTEDWLAKLDQQRQAMDVVSIEKAWSAHVQWWQDFWQRSWIHVMPAEESAGSAVPSLIPSNNHDVRFDVNAGGGEGFQGKLGRVSIVNHAFEVGQAYALQRFMTACAGRGNYPIKFNGSLFTVDGMDNYQHNPQGEYYGPDYRRWGGPYWFQNTRLIYWPMLYAGDYELMPPLFTMYRDMLPLLKERTRRYFGHEGVFFSETTHIWGLNRNECFGRGNTNFYPTSGYMKYNWDCGLELSMMMLDYYQHTEDETFAKETLLPIADQVVIFYDQHYQRTTGGTLHISPSQSLETWHTAEDPLPVVAGLRVVLAGLLALPESLTSSEQRERWQRLLGEVKEIPIAEENGKKWAKPAHVFSNRKNCENPELYAVFPYPIYGVGKPDLAIGRETYARRGNKRTGGWMQDAIQAAKLGLTDQAKSYLLENVTTENLIGSDNEKAKRPDSRFPAFWGPNFDWIPDQCNGSVIEITLQYMLMQTDGKKIHLLPAWPKDWNADFKLHAPYQTSVEGRVVKGELIDLKVIPESRRKDVVVMKQDTI